MTNLNAIIAARRAAIVAAQESKATSNGYSKGKHYCSALIRAFVTARTKKSYSNESNCDYYAVLKISTVEDGTIICTDVAGYCQHSALVARPEKSASARAGAAEGARLATSDFACVAYEWLVFSSPKVENESSEEKQARLAAAHTAAINDFQTMLNAPAPQEQAPQEQAPQEQAPQEQAPQEQASQEQAPQENKTRKTARKGKK